MSQECWGLLFSWYGLQSGQFPIPRKVIRVDEEHCIVEIYYLELMCSRNNDSPILLAASQGDLLSKIRKDMRELFEIQQNVPSRLLFAIDGGSPFVVENLEQKLDDLQIIPTSSLIIETFEGGLWNRITDDSLKIGSSSGSPLMSQPGVCGLKNLGNTSFLNSIIQNELCKLNPTFRGCYQQDAQELLTFLLDGLHEDLQKIQKNHHIGVKYQSGRTDKAIVSETWESYKERNDSIIVDTFYGFLKSTVVCPECERVSVTCEPFSSLSVPLPQKEDRIIPVRFIPYDGTKSERYFRLPVPRQGIVRDLCQELSSKVNCNGDQLLVAEITHCHFHKFYCNEDSLENIDEKDVIFVYQLPVLPISVDDEEDIIVPVCFWEKVKPIDKYSQSDLLVSPLLIGIPRKPVNEVELLVILKEKIKRHFVFHSNAETQNGALLNTGHVNRDYPEHRFSLFTMDTTKPSPFPEPLEFVDNSSNLIDIMQENYKNRFFGRMILVVQMTAEQRRELYREKPAECGPDLILSPQSSFIRGKNSKSEALRTELLISARHTKVYMKILI